MLFVDFNEWPAWRFGNKILLLNNLIQISYYFKIPYTFNNFLGLDLFENLEPHDLPSSYDEILTTNFFLNTPKKNIHLNTQKRYKLDMALFELFFTYNDLSTFDIFKLKIPNITSNTISIGAHFRGTDFHTWDKKAILPTEYYINSLEFLKTILTEDFKVYLATDDVNLVSYQTVIEWLNQNNISFHGGNIKNWKQDFYTLSQCNYVISTPSTFCITSSLCGRKNKKIIHNKEWFKQYKLHSDYFRDIFWKQLYETKGNKDYSLYKLI